MLLDAPRGVDVGDIDGDGALDLLVTTVAGPARLYRNSAPARGHWLMVWAVDPALHRDAAETRFQHAGQLDPKEPRWPFFEALVLGLRDAQAAIPLLQRAVDLCGDQLDTPRLKLAELLVEQGRADEAKAQYEQLLRHRPDHPLAHLGLARLAYERADYLGCSRHLENCLRSPFTSKAARALLVTFAAQRHDVVTAERERAIVARLAEDRAWPDPYKQELVRCRVDRRSRLAAIGDQVA